MRRSTISALLLAFLLTLSACGGNQENPGTPPQDSGEVSPPVADSSEEPLIYSAGGYEIALPGKYADQLLVETEPSGGRMGWTGWKPLISVCEKASVEAGEADYGHGTGFGFLFGLSVLDQAALEQYICVDASGADVFATDGELYFAYSYATDVQFYRSDTDIVSDHPDWPVWEELNTIGPAVREDFLARNGLQSFNMKDFMDHLITGNEVCVRYYPYFIKGGDTRIYYQLLLRQPSRQGEGGLWAVDQWLDESGNQYLYFPDSGKPAAEYYAQLQAECDAGKHPELLTPTGAAAAFAQDYFDHEVAEGSFEQVPEVDQGYMERNQALSELALDLMFDRDVDDMTLLACVGEATADNWGTLGRYMYGSDWFGPLMDAVAEAAVGEEQQQRDQDVMRFLLATREAMTDFQTPLSAVLQTQEAAAPDAWQTALKGFSTEEQAYIQASARLPG